MEKSENNDLFFVCSLIEHIARKTKNTKKYVALKLGKNRIKKIYDLAEVYHSENIDKITCELSEEANIDEGNYVLKLSDGKPTFWELGKVYQKLILKMDNNPREFVDNLMKLLSSPLIEKIDNYESSLYYENIDYLYECFLKNKIL